MPAQVGPSGDLEETALLHGANSRTHVSSYPACGRGRGHAGGKAGQLRNSLLPANFPKNKPGSWPTVVFVA